VHNTRGGAPRQARWPDESRLQSAGGFCLARKETSVWKHEERLLTNACCGKQTATDCLKKVADAVDYKNCDTPQPDAISRRAKLTSGGFRQVQPTPGRLYLTELGATTERSTERDEQNK
jgi:hypothetical protein